MTDEQIIIRRLEKIEKYFSEVEISLDVIRGSIQDILDDVKINEEVSAFILDLVDNDNIPENIRNEAGELWLKI